MHLPFSKYRVEQFWISKFLYLIPKHNLNDCTDLLQHNSSSQAPILIRFLYFSIFQGPCSETQVLPCTVHHKTNHNNSGCAFPNYDWSFHRVTKFSGKKRWGCQPMKCSTYFPSQPRIREGVNRGAILTILLYISLCNLWFTELDCSK